jgi:subtilisin family serine protease
LRRILDAAAPGARLRVIVRLRERADLSALAASAGEAQLDRRARRRLAVEALQSVARSSQQSLLEFLGRRDIAAQTDDVRLFWIFNGLALSAAPEVARAIAARPEVASVQLDEWRQRLGAGEASPTPLTGLDSRSPLSVTLALREAGAAGDGLSAADPQWGVARVRAHEVWSGLNITGANVTVANVDSGVDWQHPALILAYRGWTGGLATDHLHNWYDATDEHALYPNDLNGHGTHTMGTMIGPDGLGVAPGGRWLAAKGLNAQGYGLDSWLHAALQFLMAPNGDPDYAPDIINNSWSSDDGTDDEFAEDVLALEAAGILAVFSNGNRGPRIGSVGSPASLPGAIGIGATDQEDEVAAFSSRGPSPINGEARPHLSAPGVDVLSAYPGGGYAVASGTSMAAPHVAGAAALLLSARPALDVRAALEVLTRTAVPLSTELPNNDSGWGRLDAFAAVLSVMSTGVITGRVLDAVQPISGAAVAAMGGGRRLDAVTGHDGAYAILAPFGIYTLTAGAFGYATAVSPPRLVITGGRTQADFQLAMLPSGVARGVVTDAATGAYITATLVRALGTPEQSYASGGAPPRYYALNLPAGTYTIEARALGYLVQRKAVTITDGGISSLDFALTPTQRIAFVDTGAWYYASMARFYRSAFDALWLPYDEYRLKRVPQDTPTITQLLRYDTVVWSAPYDSPGLVGADGVISSLVSAGRNLVISGQDIAYYDGGGFRLLPYFSLLNANLRDDNSPSRVVTGQPGTLMAGKIVTIAGGDGADDQGLTDVVDVRDPDRGVLIGRYGAPSQGYDGAGVFASQCLDYRAVYLAFGFEAINSAADRADVMRRMLDAFEQPRARHGVAARSVDDYPTGPPIGSSGSVLTHTVRVRHTGEAGPADTFALAVEGNRWPTDISLSSAQLEPCGAVMAVLTVTVPATATWNQSDVVTVTARSVLSPALSASVSFTSKTPAGILLVDDDRFYDREADYLAALAAQGNTADRWDTGWRSGIVRSPPLDALRMYPMVIWYNGYDWFDPIRASDEETLSAYLEGGGRLFFSSQAGLAYTGLSAFNRRYLGVASIDFQDVTSNVLGAPGHPVGDGFIGGSLLTDGGRFPYFWNLSASVQPVTGTQVILRGDSSQPFGLARQGPAAGGGAWRAVFMPFAFEALTPTVRADLMNRAAGWLSWLGGSSLAAERATVSSGGRITFTLRVGLDAGAAPMRGPTATVMVSAPVAPELQIISSTLPGAGLHHAGAWSGALAPGQSLTWTFAAIAAPGLAAGAPLTAEAVIALSEPRLRLTRQQVVRVDAPELVPRLTFDPPEEAAWGGRVTVMLVVTNAGLLPAPAAAITGIVPTGLGLIASSLVTPGSGSASADAQRVTWGGPLAAGAAVSLTYRVSVPAFGSWPAAFYLAAQASPLAGMVAQDARWLVPRTALRQLPIVLR